jgi:hypothetical protein
MKIDLITNAIGVVFSGLVMLFARPLVRLIHGKP